MATVAAELMAVIKGDASSYINAVGQANNATKSFASTAQQTSSSTANLGKAFDVAKAAVAAFAATKVFSFAKDAVAAFEAEEFQLRKLEDAYARSTTAKDLEIESYRALADEIESYTKYTDESVMAAESMLLTTKLTGEQIQQLIPIIADFAENKMLSMEKATLLTTRALGGSTTALSRMGVTLTGVKKGADNFIPVLEGLTDKFGGFAKSIENTYGVQLAIAANKWRDFKQTIGESLEPIFTAALRAANVFLDVLMNIPKPILAAGVALGGVVLAMKAWQLATSALGNVFQPLVEMFSNFVDSAQKLAQGTQAAGDAQGVLQVATDQAALAQQQFAASVVESGNAELKAAASKQVLANYQAEYEAVLASSTATQETYASVLLDTTATEAEMAAARIEMAAAAEAEMTAELELSAAKSAQTAAATAVAEAEVAQATAEVEAAIAAEVQAAAVTQASAANVGFVKTALAASASIGKMALSFVTALLPMLPMIAAIGLAIAAWTDYSKTTKMIAEDMKELNTELANTGAATETFAKMQEQFAQAADPGFFGAMAQGVQGFFGNLMGSTSDATTSVGRMGTALKEAMDVSSIHAVQLQKDIAAVAGVKVDTKAFDAYAKAAEEAGMTVQEFAAETGTIPPTIMMTTDSMGALVNQITLFRGATDDQKMQLASLVGALNMTKEGLDDETYSAIRAALAAGDFAKALELAAQAGPDMAAFVKSFGSDMENLAQVTGTSSAAIQSSLVTAMQDAKDPAAAVMKVYNDLAAGLAEFSGNVAAAIDPASQTLQQFAGDAHLSMGKMQQALNENMKAMREFGSNLDTILKKGGPDAEALVQQLAQMGPAAYGMARAIASSGPKMKGFVSQMATAKSQAQQMAQALTQALVPSLGKMFISLLKALKADESLIKSIEDQVAAAESGADANEDLGRSHTQAMSKAQAAANKNRALSASARDAAGSTGQLAGNLDDIPGTYNAQVKVTQSGINVQTLFSQLQNIAGTFVANIVTSLSGGKKGHAGGLVPEGLQRFHQGGLGEDEVPAILKKGEFVLRASAVRKHGKQALLALNAGAVPDKLRREPGLESDRGGVTVNLTVNGGGNMDADRLASLLSRRLGDEIRVRQGGRD